MHLDLGPFFGWLTVRTPLVRSGRDQFLPWDRRAGVPRHTLIPVYVEMLRQVCRDYASLPDPRTLRLHEIRFFYEGLRHGLQEATKPKTSRR